MDFNSLKSAAAQFLKDAMPGGALNAEWTPGNVENAKFAAGFTPIIGDAISAYDTVKAMKEGNYPEAALSAAGMLPFVPGITKSATPRIQKMLDAIFPDDIVEARKLIPPHEVRDKEKLERLAASMESEGWKGRPILVYDVGRGLEALTGSHRIKAAEKAGIDIPIVRVDDSIGDYVDKNGVSIIDAAFGDSLEISKYLKKFGDNRASDLMKIEDFYQVVR